jgi:energy-coupling factor transport system substrate-specific component
VQKEKLNPPKKLSKRTLLASVLILLVIPATILFGIFFLNDRRYYFVSLLLVTYSLLPFFFVFENRKPQARELVVIAVLVALAVAGRGAFFMLPQFKPVLAIVIISALAFGAETGFLVGALTAFVSNFFFGQGPWTPWQMFAMGIIGFLAGILFQKGILSRKKFPLCLFGALTTFLIYGGIMNPSSVLMFTSRLTWESLIAAYISGFWFDLVHAVSTVFFLYVLTDPMLDKLDRIKIKYGILRE